MKNKERFDNFIKEYKELCIKHNIYLEVSHYDELCAFSLKDDDLKLGYIWDIKNEIS